MPEMSRSMGRHVEAQWQNEVEAKGVFARIDKECRGDVLNIPKDQIAEFKRAAKTLQGHTDKRIAYFRTQIELLPEPEDSREEAAA